MAGGYDVRHSVLKKTMGKRAEGLDQGGASRQRQGMGAIKELLFLGGETTVAVSPFLFKETGCCMGVAPYKLVLWVRSDKSGTGKGER